MSSQGTASNKNGKMLEDSVESIFIKYGFECIKDSIDVPQIGIYYKKNVAFQGIYKGKKNRSEFVLYENGSACRIECKWQSVPGSAEEKLPYLYECMKKVPEKYVMIVIDGPGWSDGAKAWIKDQAATCESKKMYVGDLTYIGNLMHNLYSKNTP